MDKITEKFEYHGLISDKAPVLLMISYAKYNPEKLSADLFLLSRDAKKVREFAERLSGDEYGNLKIKSEEAYNPEIALRNISGWTHQGSNASLSIGGFEQRHLRYLN